MDTLPVAARSPVAPRVARSGIVHLGLGAFHRAHQAVYTEDAIAVDGGDWGIVGVAPHSRDVLDRMNEQDRMYSVLTVDGDVVPRVVAVHSELMHAASDPLAVVRRLADPAIRVVTLTVTEKAYGLDPVTGAARVDDDLRADLLTDRPPRTLPGLLVRGLLARAAGSGAPVAVVSCDNLPSNGRRLAELAGAAFDVLPGPAGARARDWLAASVTFPGTTVDRIVPASTAATVELARASLGVTDLVPVLAEPYSQWVIEDEFPAGRPAWDRAGAIFTGDARPWEQLKLRTLNGLHSALAYLGGLAGCETIAQALRLPGMDDFLDRLVADDIAPTLAPPPGQSVRDYGLAARGRFANPALGHLTSQVAMDGTQKLPQRLFGPLAERRAVGARPAWAALVLAAWMRFVRGYADDGRALPLDDPLADTLRAAVAAAPDTPDGLAGALFGLADVFPAELSGDDGLRALVAQWLTVLSRGGALAALATVASEVT